MPTFTGPTPSSRITHRSPANELDRGNRHSRSPTSGRCIRFDKLLSMTRASDLFLNPSLVRTRNLHVFPIFCDRSASDLNTLRLKDACDLFVSQRAAGVF